LHRLAGPKAPMSHPSASQRTRFRSLDIA
jgi:hypothetical protein